MPAVFSLSDISHNTFEKHVSAQPHQDAVGGWKASNTSGKDDPKSNPAAPRSLAQAALPLVGLSDVAGGGSEQHQTMDAGKGSRKKGATRQDSDSEDDDQAEDDDRTEDGRLADWAEQWPFPHFGLDGPVDTRYNKKNRVDGRKEARHSITTSSGDDNDSEEASDASTEFNDEFVQLVTPHPLSSDWNLSFKARTQRGLNHHTPSPRSITAGSSTGDGLLSCKVGGRSPMNTGRTVGSAFRAQGSAPCVTRDELTALLATFDHFNPLGAGFAMKHMDLRWLVSRSKGSGGGKSRINSSVANNKNSIPRGNSSSGGGGVEGGGSSIARPAVHLNLGNIAGALNSGHVRERQVLVNSPRSAVLLLRHGVSLQELRKDISRAALKAEEDRHKTNLSWAERRAIATEKVRQKKLEALTVQYHSLCDQLSFDSIVSFCSQLDPAHASSALKLRLGHDGPPVEGSTSLGVSEPTALGGCRPLSSSTQRRSNSTQLSFTNDSAETSGAYLNGKERSVARLHRMDAQFSQMESRQRTARTTQHELEIQHRRYVVGKVTEKEMRAQSALQEKARGQEVRRTISSGQAELWKTQNTSHSRIEKFRTLITSQRSQRRLDEVVVLQAENRSGAEKFRDSVRQRRVKENQRRAKESEQYLKDARRDFLQQQM